MKAPTLSHNITKLVAVVAHVIPPMHLSQLSTTSQLRRGANRVVVFTNRANTSHLGANSGTLLRAGHCAGATHPLDRRIPQARTSL
jgi:hypothetical protein